MNRKIGLVLVFAVFAAGGIFAQAPVTLDEAIRLASDDLVARLPNKTKIAVVNFVSPSEQFSNYVLEELTAALVNSGHFVVVDRQNIDVIQKEMDFQYSGEVNDETMQSIGQKLGAQSIFSGSFGEVAGNYRLRFRTINVETAAIEVLTNAAVKRDAQTDSLFAAPVTITGLTWTTQQKVGKGALNMLFGVGSFTMGDPLGGAIVGVVEAAGFVMFGISFMTTETTTDGFVTESDTTMRAWLVPGIIAWVGGAIFGYFRPFMYDKSLAKRKGLVFTPNNINIAMLPGDNGTALQLSYTFHL